MMGSTAAPSMDFAKLEGLFPEVQDSTKAIWYIYAGVVLEVTSHPEYIDGLWKHVIKNESDEKTQLILARRLRETFLKTCVLAGFPRGINCLAALKAAIKDTSPKVAETLDQDKSMRDPVPANEMEKRGEEFFGKVYAQHTQRVIENMRSTSGGDLDQFALFSVYGELMAETRILSAKETGLLEFVACYASMAVPQGKGHMYGSRNLGNNGEEIRAAIKLVQEMAPQTQPVVFDQEAFPWTSKADSW